MLDSFVENRIIRVFISSTFRDMQDERNYLVKKVFPVLKEKAERRNVSIVPVDLRWGITEEESNSGKVLGICLKEIDNSYPFFIGIIGNRYGWCPKKEEVLLPIGQFEWLEQDILAGLSVTEIEIQYGVLRNPREMNAHFYMKQEICPPEAVDNPEKLRRLKDTIRNNGRYPVDDYSSVEDLGHQVERAFVSLLDRLFPNESLSEEEIERQEHLSYLTRLRRFYIPDKTGFDELSGFLESDSEFCVIGGKKGSGKSALVSNWLSSVVDSKCYRFVYHNCGVGERGNDAGRVIERIEREATRDNKRLLLIVDNLPDESKWRPLSNYLFARKSYGGHLCALDSYRKVIVIDRYAGKNSWDCDYYYEVPDHADTAYWQAFVEQYLLIFQKKLSGHQIARVVSNPIFYNASLMRVFLDELVSFGSYDRLNEHIDYLCKATSEEDFYENLLPLLEQEFGEDLVKSVLCLLLVSKEGIPEDFLLPLIRCTQLRWSQLFCSLTTFLIPSGTRIRLTDSNMENAAMGRYGLNDELLTNDYRIKLLHAAEDNKSTYSFVESCHQLQVLGRYEPIEHLVFESYPTYGVTEDILQKVMIELVQKELSRAEGPDETQFRFVVKVVDQLLPMLFRNVSEQGQIRWARLSRVIRDIPFLFELLLYFDENLSFADEKERLLGLYSESKQYLMSLIDNPDITWKGRISDVLTELCDGVNNVIGQN